MRMAGAMTLGARYILGGAMAVMLGGSAAQAVVPVTLVVKQGDVIGARTVSVVNAPFTDGNGRVGLVVNFSDATRGIWWHTGTVFNSSDLLPLSLTGGESTMGVSNTGGFIYSPSVDGNDAVVTHGGVLLKATDPVPPLPGLFSRFNSRPRMLPDGTAVWVGGTAATPTGSTTNRHLFRASDPTDPMSITRVLGGGDVIAGKAISMSASNFDYEISDNGLNHIHILDMVTGSSANNIHVYVNGAFVAQESLPTGQGDNWSNFDTPSINDLGNYIFSGDTDGPTATDAFLAYNGVIGVREGGTLDGVTIAAGAAMRAASINNFNQVAFLWGWGSGTSLREHLFYGPGPSLHTSVRLLSLGDDIDVDNDTIADFRVTDFNASAAVGPGLNLAEDGQVCVEIDMVPVAGGAEINAIVCLAVPEPATFALIALGFAALRGGGRARRAAA
jgi:hypothetical protein